MSFIHRTKLGLILGSLVLSMAAQAQIIFDNFNIDEGHFNQDPNFSATSVGDDPLCTADPATGGALEGAGFQTLFLVHDVSATPLRIRHLSGSGTPAGQSTFTTGAGTDGFIGFYARTVATGWELSINLDGPGNTTAEMDGSLSTAIISDGAWHLYEWNLDATTGWGAVPGIGGGHAGAVANSSHTIDSIYFRDLDGTPGPNATIDIDFVAWNSSGSIANLLPVPEPSTVALGLMGGVGLLAGYIRRRK